MARRCALSRAILHMALGYGMAALAMEASMSRVRSPNFPVISMPQAIERIEAVYDKEQTLPAMRETIADHLGYSGLNGASLKIISALGKYGLLEEVGGKGFRVTKLAMAIMHPANPKEKTDALTEAAAMPALFQKLTDQFDGQRPSETNLRSWLLRNGFAKSAVDSVIKAYGETMDLVSGGRVAYSDPAAKAQIEPERDRVQVHQVHRVGSHAYTPPPQQPSEPFSVELLKGRVRVVGELSNQQDATMLIKFLQSTMLFLPTEEVLRMAEKDGPLGIGPEDEPDDE